MIIDIKKILLTLFESVLVILLFQQNVFPSALTFLTLFLTIIVGLLLILCDGKLYINPFMFSYGAFLILAIIPAAFGWGTGNVTERIGLLVMQYTSSICIYNYLMKIDDPERFFKIYIIVSIISLLIIFYLVGDNAISSRLGHNGSGSIVSYYIWGRPIYKSSNGTANFCAIAALFLMYYASLKKKRLYYIPVLVLTIGLVLCGSRKGLLIFIIYIVYIAFFLKKGINIKKLFLFLVTPFLIYILIMKIPFVYNMVGVRIESMIMNIFGYTNNADGNSYIVRQKLKMIAYEWISKRPFTGYGINAFQTQTGNGAENNVLQIALDFGVIGVLVYYSFLIPLIKTIFRPKNKKTILWMVTVLMFTILIQDYGSVTYSWLHMTIWYSVYFAVYNRTLKKEKMF